MCLPAVPWSPCLACRAGITVAAGDFCRSDEPGRDRARSGSTSDDGCTIRGIVSRATPFQAGIHCMAHPVRPCARAPVRPCARRVGSTRCAGTFVWPTLCAAGAAIRDLPKSRSARHRDVELPLQFHCNRHACRVGSTSSCELHHKHSAACRSAGVFSTSKGSQHAEIAAKACGWS